MKLQYFWLYYQQKKMYTSPKYYSPSSNYYSSYYPYPLEFQQKQLSASHSQQNLRMRNPRTEQRKSQQLKPFCAFCQKTSPSRTLFRICCDPLVNVCSTCTLICPEFSSQFICKICCKGIPASFIRSMKKKCTENLRQSKKEQKGNEKHQRPQEIMLKSQKCIKKEEKEVFQYSDAFDFTEMKNQLLKSQQIRDEEPDQEDKESIFSFAPTFQSSNEQNKIYTVQSSIVDEGLFPEGNYSLKGQLENKQRKAGKIRRSNSFSSL